MTTIDRPQVVAQLLAMAESMGITLDELAAASASRPPEKSMRVKDFLPAVEAATTDGAMLTYRPYWRLLVAQLGDRPVAEVKTTDLRALALEAQRRAKRRSNTRGGTSARENCVGALRAFFRLAVEDGLIETNPAEQVTKPRRPASRRRGFTDEELHQLFDVTRTGGDDPVLDSLLLRFHLETGARRGGALALRRRDLDAVRQCVRLREKNNTERWQPISKTLLDALIDHADHRGAVGEDDAVFRRWPRRGATVGVPVTRRRYNTLVTRWARELPWVKEQGVSIHWCRHHATSAIERIGGYAVARAFAGHAEGGEVTTTYIKAQINEVARAVASYTGEPHPLA